MNALMEARHRLRRLLGFVSMNAHATLARRMGKTVHASPLRFKVRRLLKEYPHGKCDTVEDWLVQLANTRGARVVVSPSAEEASGPMLAASELSDEELTVAICQFNCLDRPQMLRLAAQLISRGGLDLRKLIRLAILERVEPVLAELARQALKVAPDHSAWRGLHDRFGHLPPLSDALLHWTRLAEPVMEYGRPNASRWKLVA